MGTRVRRRRARGNVVLVRYADDSVAGFEHKDDAERFLATSTATGEVRLSAASGEDASDRVRPLCGGARAKRGASKPETFNFLASLTFVVKIGKAGFCFGG